MLPSQLNYGDFRQLVGFLEGEGCFWLGKQGSVGFEFTTTDKDVAESMAKLLGIEAKPSTSTNPLAKKVSYRARIFGEPAIIWMKALWPFLGIRRQDKILSILDYREKHGRGHAQRTES